MKKKSEVIRFRNGTSITMKEAKEGDYDLCKGMKTKAVRKVHPAVEIAKGHYKEIMKLHKKGQLENYISISGLVAILLEIIEAR